MVKTIYPIIVIIILLYFVYRLFHALKERNKDLISVIGILVSVVGIFSGDTVSNFVCQIPTIISELIGINNRISFPDDCDLDNILVYDGHTYAICETKIIDDFWHAEDLCEKHNGHLAVINTESENTKLYDYFIAKTGLSKESAYFGYTDYDNEGHWFWVDGSPSGEEGGFENWCEKPNNLNGVEDYALFWSKDPAYTWNDGDFGKNSEDEVIFIIEWDFVDKSMKRS